jgi:hypothetical protein
MPPIKPRPTQLRSRKSVKVTTLAPSGKPKKTFFEEFFYPLIGAEFVLTALLVKAAGMSLYEATLVGSLVTALTAVAWQFRQYAKFKGVAAPPPPPKVIKSTTPAAKPPATPVKRVPTRYFPPLMDRKPKQ